MFLKNRNVVQKFIFWSKIEMLFKNLYFGQKSMFVKNLFDEFFTKCKYLFSTKITIFAKNPKNGIILTTILNSDRRNPGRN